VPPAPRRRHFLLDSAALRIFETRELAGMELFGGRIDQSCAETSLCACGVQNLIF